MRPIVWLWLALIGLSPVSVWSVPRQTSSRGITIVNEKKQEYMNVTLYKLKGDQEISVDPNKTTFGGGEQFKVSLEPFFDGYLYVLNEDPGGNLTVLYPRPQDQDTVNAGKTITLPTFQIDNEPGDEALQIFVSPQPIKLFDEALQNNNGQIDRKLSLRAVEELNRRSSKSTSRFGNQLPFESSRSIRIYRGAQEKKAKAEPKVEVATEPDRPVQKPQMETKAETKVEATPEPERPVQKPQMETNVREGGETSWMVKLPIHKQTRK